jgi:hypothetical protein
MDEIMLDATCAKVLPDFADVAADETLRLASVLFHLVAQQN